MAEFTPAPPVPNTRFLINPSELLLQALGKTRKHLIWRDAQASELYSRVEDETGFYSLPILVSEWPKDLEIYEYEATRRFYKRTVLKSEYVEEPDEPERKKPEKVVKAKKVETTTAATAAT